MDTSKERSGWSDQELEASIDAYLKMMSSEQNGLTFKKSVENQLLRDGPLSKRSASSIEYRMQNISAVLEQMDFPRIEGYMPAKNFGMGIGQRIRNILDKKVVPGAGESAPTAHHLTLISRAANLQKKGLKVEPKGNANPQQVSVTTMSYARDPKIRAWVAELAKGVCEGCGQNAPFEVDGLPFLEVHHVKHLAQKGSDSITNAVALCPNCHRRCHLSSDKHDFKLSLYRKVKRLIIE
ncbi:HNH endonuclease signature motif containing protein [Pseudomonas sp. DR48]|uniref:HNH endonuclease n=1 Tax=Pseudomonas sp. DR48 TaxID=2871095 RepID=UPI001C99A2FB|nr:HNH endonuclease signature motif containing protein [Pseudomonas sp. DR48]QZP33103.1 HNH endonuclease [Pseudomonas sp. DR48]